MGKLGREFSKVLPPNEYPMRDLPRDHPLFRTQFTVERVPQIPSINRWDGTGSTRSAEPTAPSRTRSGSPTAKAGCWRWSPTTPISAIRGSARVTTSSYFYTFSVDGYAFGINALLYAMTH